MITWLDSGGQRSKVKVTAGRRSGEGWMAEIARVDNLMTRLQSVLRAAARLIIQVPSRAPVSGVMRDVLHWLSFPHVCHSSCAY